MRIDGPQITGSFNLNGDTVADLDIFTTTSSFNLMTASMATTASNLFKGTQTHSGSIVPSVNNTYDLGSPTHQFRHVYISTGSLYIDGTKVLGSTSSELQITTDVGQSFKVLETGADTITLQSNDGNVTLTSTGGGDIVMDPSTGVIGLKGTVTIYTGNKITSSDGNAIQFGNGISITGSIVATGTNLISGSSQVLNGSGVWSGSAQLPSGIISGSAQLPSGIVSSSSQVTNYGFSTTGSNNFQGTQTITGSLYISSDLIVQGSSSLENITASAVNIGTNIINLNTANPAIRFAGISVFDSGSIGGSGSFLYDAVQDEFIFVHRGDGANITSSVVMMGPQTYNNVGNETYPTNNRILKGTGNEHIGDSIISEIGGGIGISGSLSITGSIVATGTSLWSSSAQLPSGIISGSAQLPSGIVSGSSQINVLSTTNISRIATTGSNSFTGTQTFGYGRIVSSGHNSSAQITINASYDGGQTNTYTPDYAGDNTAGMFVMKQSNGGYGDFNFYGKNHQTTGGSHDISTFNIIMGMNTNGRVGVGKLNANAQLDVNGNTLVTGSITSTGNISAGTTFNWNGGIGALSYGSGVVTLETNTANAIQLKTNGTTAITISTGQTVTLSDNLVFSKGVDPKISSGTGIGLNIDGAALYLNRYSQSNIVMVQNGGNVGIGDSPSKKLTINFGTTVSDGLLVTGSQRQETRFKSSGEHSNVFIDSAHSNIFLPTLGLLRNGTTFGEVRLQRASNSDSIGSYTESEMIMGSITTVPVSIQTNNVRRINVESGGIVNIYNQLNQRSGLRMNNGTGGSSPRITFGTEDESVPGNKSIYLDNYWMVLQPHVNEGLRVRFVNGSGSQTETVRLQSSQASFYTSISSAGSISASGNMGARNFNNAIKSWSSNGSYTWSTELSALAGFFDSACWYKGFIRESNGAHYYGYQFDIHVGQIGYGGASNQFIVRNMTYAGGPWVGGCGGSSFAAIDNSGFTKQNSGCFDSLELFITRLG
jgi:hypothetical protein